MYKRQSMIKNRFYLEIMALMVILLLFTYYAIYLQTNNTSPKIQQGVLDLTDWDFDKDGIVKLNGQWRFIPGITDQTQQTTQFATVPGKMPLKEKQGAGTYYIKVLLPPNKKHFLGVNVEGVRFSHTFKVNGEVIHQEGQPAETREQYELKNIPYVAFFNVEGREMEIRVQVANFHYYLTGIHLPMYIGNADDINYRQKSLFSLELFVGAMCSVLMILFLTIYSSLIRERSLLIFAIYFVFTSIFILTTSQKPLLQLFPEFPFILYVKIRDFTMYATFFLLTEYVLTLFQQKSKYQFVLRWVGIIYLAYAVVALVGPYEIIGGRGDSILLPMFTVVYSMLVFYTFRRYQRGDASIVSRRELEFFILFLLSIVSIAIASLLYYMNILDSLALAGASYALSIFFILSMFYGKFRDTYLSMVNYAQKLKREDELKDEFLFRTAHELKTPLHGIINLAQLSLDTMHTHDYSTIEKNNRLIKTTALRMSRLVNDLVDFSLIKENKFRIDMKATDVRYCITAVIEVLDYVAREKNIQMTIEVDQHARYVFADEARLIQIIYNLVYNALQHTTEGSIQITTSRAQNEIFIHVKDTGVGIAKENFQRIFEPYERGENRSYDDGLGLGLAISKQLMQQMDGDVFLHWSEVGKGAHFVLTLHPASAHELQHTQETHYIPLNEPMNTEQTLTTKGTILIVDDEPLNREVLKEILKYQDHEIIEAENGEQVFTWIESGKEPDLILLDVMLGDTTGYEVCRKIRENYSLIDIPVLFITVNHSIRDISQAFTVGGNDFLTKPFEAEEVRARVNTLLKMKQLSRQAAENEMAFLQSQIKPHFLFNTLSAIMTFSYEDADKSYSLLESLSTYLRIVFQTSRQTEWIPMTTEYQITKAFVAIQQERYGDRLQVVFDVDDDVLHCFTPPLLLQPLVENAIAHGVLKRMSGGSVHVKIEKNQGGIQVTVQDDGVGMTQDKIAMIFAEQAIGSGVGLANVQKRILRMTKQPLMIDSVENQGTTMSYWIPKMFSQDVKSE